MGKKTYANNKNVRQMISVCMATYNGEKYIKEQIESILDQLSPEDELIISDDNSADKTIEIIENIKDKRIKILFHNQNKKLSKLPNHYKVTKNFENALKAATGDYIFLADQDDIWLKNKVSECLHFLKDYDLVMTNHTIINSAGKIYNEFYRKTDPTKENFLKLIYSMPFQGCCLAFKKDILKYVLPFPKDLISHDNWIGFISKFIGKTYFIREPLIFYRRHGSNASRTTEKSNNSFFFKLNYRIIFVRQIVKRIGINLFLKRMNNFSKR
jgi:glycosyltransferase involved in cell wall biosynthesis